MVVIKLVVKASSEKRSSKQLLPTPKKKHVRTLSQDKETYNNDTRVSDNEQFYKVIIISSCARAHLPQFDSILATAAVNHSWSDSKVRPSIQWVGPAAGPPKGNRTFSMLDWCTLIACRVSEAGKLVVCTVSEVLTSAVKTALISVGFDVGNKSSGSLILEKISFCETLSELSRIFWKAQKNASGLFLFFFHPAEVMFNFFDKISEFLMLLIIGRRVLSDRESCLHCLLQEVLFKMTFLLLGRGLLLWWDASLRREINLIHGLHDWLRLLCSKIFVTDAQTIRRQ